MARETGKPLVHVARDPGIDDGTASNGSSRTGPVGWCSGELAFSPGRRSSRCTVDRSPQLQCGVTHHAETLQLDSELFTLQAVTYEGECRAAVVSWRGDGKQLLGGDAGRAELEDPGGGNLMDVLRDGVTAQ